MMEQWFTGVVSVTERFLTWRKRRRVRKKEKQKKRHPIIEWIDAFLWAAAVVLLINQYLFQAYQIPTGSMENTLKIADRIFVNKLIYGPELIPGMWKMPGLFRPDRNDVIIFESPTYISKGPAFDVLQRVLYMLTLSLVDIDRDETGAPRAHFLIKRAVGMGGDQLRIRRGEVEIKPPGAVDWRAESELRFHDPVDFTRQRLISASHYPAIEAAVRVATYRDQEITPLESDEALLASSGSMRNDAYHRTMIFYDTMHRLNPQHPRYRSEYRKYDLGWYVPANSIFPMGDNRDNSNDARYFGPVALDDVLGRGMFIYWPITRLSRIR
jgi:signal peptidase I